MTTPAFDLDQLRQDLSGLTQEPAGPPKKKPGEPLDLVAMAEDLKGARPSALPSRPPVAAPTTPSASARRFPDVQPRWDRFGEPMNEAAQDIETARGGVAADTSSTAERARRFGQAAVLSMGVPFTPLTPEEARAPATQAAATRYGPAAVGRVQQLAAQPGTPAGERPSFLRSLYEASPLAAVPGLLRREPEAYGGLAGMVLQAELLRPGPGVGVVRGTQAPGVGGAFRTLGLDPATATVADVEAAWRQAAMRTHPDVPAPERAARGGPTDPVVAAQEFNAARQARYDALESLGQQRPVQAQRPAPAPAAARPTPGPTPPSAMTDEELAAQPMGRTPPVEESAAAPGAQEAQVTRAMGRAAARARRGVEAPPQAQAAPGEAIPHPALSPEARIAFTAPEGDPLKAQKESLAAKIAGDGPSFAPIARMRQQGATDAEIAAHIKSQGVPKPQQWVDLARTTFQIPEPGGAPVSEMPTAVEAGAPHDQAAIQEALPGIGEKKLAGREQTELLPETAGVPTAKLKAEKIAPEEVGRVKREGTEPEGEKPMELAPEAPAGKKPKGQKYGYVERTPSGKPVMQVYAEALAQVEKRPADDVLTSREVDRLLASSDNPGMNVGEFREHTRGLMEKLSRFAKGAEARVQHAKLSAQIARDEQIMGAGTSTSVFTDVGAHIGQPGQKFTRTKRTGPAYAAAGRLAQARKRLAALEKTMTPEELQQARTAAETAMPEVAEKTSAQVGAKEKQPPTQAEIERAAIAGEPERPKDYEELAKKQAGPIPPPLKDLVYKRLIEYGDTKEELDKRLPLDLANRALELDVLSPDEETRLLNAVWPDMGALIAARRKGAPLPQVTEPTRSVRDAFRKLLYPEKRGVEAEVAARLLRRAIGQMRRDKAVYRQMLKDARHQVPSLKTAEGIEWYDRAENGVGQVRPELQQAADIIRKIYDGLVRDIQALGTGKLAMPIENYMAHGWKDPAKAKQVYREIAQSQARRPLAGSKAFLKERTIPRMVDGLRRNLEPITDNAVDLNLWKMDQMRKYLFAQRFMQDAKAENIARFFRLGENLPDGWGRIEDPTFAVYGRSESGELVLRGHWAMPTIARDLVANYLSPGLRGNPIADAWLGAANSMVQFKLGASGFHAGFSTYTGAISRTALAIGKIRTMRQPFTAPTKGGILGGAAGALIGGTAGGPGGAGLGVELGSVAGRLLQKGLALKAVYLDPASGTVLEQRMADLMARSGAQHQMPDEYRTATVASLKAAARSGNLPKAVAHTAALVLQTLAWPTMQFYVPLVKMGAFADLMPSELERLGSLATEAQVDKAAQDIWHTIDNRFGQVSYDTRFWNNAMKHVMMGAIQAVGWDVGTVDEHLGGLMDILKGKPSLRFDFFLALPLTVALLNVLIQLALTGEGPSSVQDVFEPRNGKVDEFGNPERMTPATYMKDIISFGRHPVRTVLNKLNPLVGFLGRLLSNRDFYGNKWRNENDPAAVQLKQAWKFVRDEWAPISVKNVQEERRRGVTGGRGLLPLVGITPAGREAVRTKAQNMMIQMLRERTPARTPEEQEAALAKREERQGLSPDQRLLGMFRKLSPDQRHQVYAAASGRERELFGPYVERRMRAYRK